MNSEDNALNSNSSDAKEEQNSVQPALLKDSSVNEIVKNLKPAMPSQKVIGPMTYQDSSINEFLNQVRLDESYNIDNGNTKKIIEVATEESPKEVEPVKEVATPIIEHNVVKEAPREVLSRSNALKKEFIKVTNVFKEYGSDEARTIALNDVSFEIYEGELVIFLGQSGAGKTTALNMIGGMDTVTSGRIIVGDKEITEYDEDELTEYRRDTIGFVFQYYNLVNNLTAKENVELATEISDDYVDARIILDKVGLSDKYDKIPSQLSGGEQQRVAIARAMAKKPKLLLCDEPTGALDYVTGKQVLALLQKTNRESNITTIIITHNQAITPMADKVIKFKSGTITDIIINEHPVNVEDLEW